MTKYSGTYAGAIAQLIITILTILNADFGYTQDEIEKSITIIIALGVAVYTLYRRYMAGGVDKLGFYK